MDLPPATPRTVSDTPTGPSPHAGHACLLTSLVPSRRRKKSRKRFSSGESSRPGSLASHLPCVLRPAFFRRKMDFPDPTGARGFRLRGASSTGQGAPNTGLGAPSTGLGARRTGRGARSAGRGARSTGRGARSTGQGARSTGQGAPSTGQGARGTGQGARSTGQGARSARQGAPCYDEAPPKQPRTRDLRPFHRECRTRPVGSAPVARREDISDLAAVRRGRASSRILHREGPYFCSGDGRSRALPA